MGGGAAESFKEEKSLSRKLYLIYSNEIPAALMQKVMKDERGSGWHFMETHKHTSDDDKVLNCLSGAVFPLHTGKNESMSDFFLKSHTLNERKEGRKDEWNVMMIKKTN